MKFDDRNSWLVAEDNDLLELCTLDFYKSTGRGGQKKNKSSSAVRLSHKPTGIVVTASEERDQHVNRRRALRRLRYQLAYQVRSEQLYPPISIELSPNNKQYYLWIAFVFDVLDNYNYDIKLAAASIDLSPSKLNRLLGRDSETWRNFCEKRESLGLKPLKRT